MSNPREIIDDTIAALEALKRSGVTHVEVSRSILEELGQPIRAAATSAVARPTITAAPQPRFQPIIAPAPVELSDIQGDDVATAIQLLNARAKACTKCSELSRCRTNVVFGTGNLKAELMFIGEAPGADEDEQGKPFVGRAGQLLTKIIEAMGLTRDEVYIANVLKCRPPDNRPPLPEEVANCLPFLLKQIDLIKPKVMVALGATAVRSLLDVQIGISKMRGNWYTFHDTPIMPTFHPAYLLRNPPAKKEVWDDMKMVLAKMGRKPPARASS